MGQRPAGRAAESVTDTTAAVGTAAGVATQRAGVALQRAGTALERQSATVAPALGAAVGTTVATVADRVAPVVGTVADRVGTVAGAVVEAVEGLVEEPGTRAGAAFDALRGSRVGPPVAVRRWPWALGAAVGGALAGAGVALLVRRLQGQDPPGAQEPHELRAVVDVPDGRPEPAATEDLPLPPPA